MLNVRGHNLQLADHHGPSQNRRLRRYPRALSSRGTQSLGQVLETG